VAPVFFRKKDKKILRESNPLRCGFFFSKASSKPLRGPQKKKSSLPGTRSTSVVGDTRKISLGLGGLKKAAA
jgi:hypothetical protein